MELRYQHPPNTISEKSVLRESTRSVLELLALRVR
jgi:hypothetical protein